VAGRRPRLTVLLADKSALEWARRDKRARAAFLGLRTAHVIAACHMTALEIGYSARNQADLEALVAGQRALEWLPVSEAVMDRALEVQRLLAADSGNGRRRPIPDLIIAATAELHGAEVLHVGVPLLGNASHLSDHVPGRRPSGGRSPSARRTLPACPVCKEACLFGLDGSDDVAAVVAAAFGCPTVEVCRHRRRHPERRSARAVRAGAHPKHEHAIIARGLG
jgi:predicted nucleic acid-binding protein